MDDQNVVPRAQIIDEVGPWPAFACVVVDGGEQGEQYADHQVAQGQGTRA